MNQKNRPAPFAKKSFGQNFLVDKNYIEKIIRALDLQTGETVVEIGPGRGALTERLIESGASVVAIELERDMIAVLKEKFIDAENFELVEADALKIDFADVIGRKSENANRKCKLVANLPYYISTAILQKLIEQRAAFSQMVLMFQREVVDRITAEVGNKERGFLTVLTEAFLDSEKLFDVPPEAFRPPPKVRSAVVRLKPKTESFFTDDNLFREIISAAFLQKRKTILNNLKNARVLKEKNIDAENILAESGIAPNRRAESLEINEWKQILAAIT